MTKSTPEVSTRFVFKSSPEAFISPLFFKNKFTLGLHLDFYLATITPITPEPAIHPNRDGAIYRATAYYLFLIELMPNLKKDLFYYFEFCCLLLNE